VTIRTTPKPRRAPLSAWRFVIAFGTVSLLGDILYQGARSISGPLLASLGATSLVVGAVTGVGESAALVLRLASGALADRTRQFWAWTIAGYAVTVLTVPFLGLAGVLWVACALVIAERVGKAVRSPAKDTLLSHATAATGRGRGFAVHKSLDQVGALIGPLVVAAVLAATGGDYAPALGVLAAPGVALLALVLWLRWRVPEPARYEIEVDVAADAVPAPAGVGHWFGTVPREFWVYSGFSAATTLGLATFGLLSFHMVETGLVAVVWVPVVYAAAMVAVALAALATGWRYDRLGSRVLAILPVVSALATVLAFGRTVAGVIGGALLWGAAVGVQESTMRAVVADLVPTHRRATAYGLYAGVVGGATAVGGALLGWLYQVSVPLLVWVVVAVQVVAAVLLWLTRRAGGSQAVSPDRAQGSPPALV
jgi:MFS family permease